MDLRHPVSCLALEMSRQRLESSVDTGWTNGNVRLFCEDVGLFGGNEE